MSDAGVLWSIAIVTPAIFLFLLYLPDIIFWMKDQRVDHARYLAYNYIDLKWLYVLFLWLLYSVILLVLLLVGLLLMFHMIKDVIQWLKE